MGDLYKKNYKRLTGVRGEDPVNPLHIVRVKDVAGSGGGGGTVAMGGDVTGTSAVSVVAAVQGQPVSTTSPASGEALVWNGSAWESAAIVTSTPPVTNIGEEFRVDIPGGASLAAKIAGATLPVGWSIVLANDGSVDAQIAATAADIVLIHTESSFVGDLRLHEFDGGAAPLGGYYVINDGGVGLLSKSNSSGTQFSVLGFTGLITLSRRQIVYAKLLPTP